jgi:DNA-binding CsgD family transcriptional regulator
MNPYSAIETAFAAAAKDGSKWNAAMEATAAATGSFRAILLPVPQAKAPIIPLSESLRSTSEIKFANGWVQHALGYRGVSKLLRDGVICNSDCETPEEIEFSPCHQEPIERESLTCFAGVKVTADDDLWCLFIQRSIQQGPFSGAELKKLADLSPVLSSAATQARALDFERAEGALSAFGVINLPAALLDRYGQLILMNHASEQLFGNDVAIRGGRVASFIHDATVALNQALHEFMLSSDPSILMPFVPLPRRGDRRPLLASAIRLSAVSQNVFARCQAILILIDLDAHPQPSESVLCRCFGLSAAEARLAKGIATGKSLTVMADELTIAKQTARHQLKSVFAKLNVHRQSELVALLSVLPQ